MISNQILERSNELRERAEALVRCSMARTHLRILGVAWFYRHVTRRDLSELRTIVAELDNLVEAGYLAGCEETCAERKNDAHNQREADRHEPVASWETEP